VKTASAIYRLALGSTDNTAVQVPRALAASVFAAVFDFGSLVILVERAGWRPVPAAVVGYLLGVAIQYLLCSFWVFPASSQSHASGFGVFVVLSLVGLGITWAVMAVAYDLAGLEYLFAKVLALGLSFAWNFLSRKYLLFRPPQPAVASA
jgi:putative flippase GtrA